MSKFIPKHKDLSSQINSSASTESEPESLSPDQQQEKTGQPKSSHGLLTRCQQGVTVTINGIKRVSTPVIEQFTGPRKLHRRPWFWLGISAGGGAIALGVGWVVLENSLPDSTADLLTYVRDDTITIKAEKGEILQQIGPATRETIKIDDVPKTLTQAFLATEDQRFEKHHGVDYQGILRALLSNIQAGDVVEGGSTITQQLARIVYFNQERTIARKLKEMLMAQRIEKNVDKNTILERYLNLVYLGSGAYGVADAAWVYFSKSVKDLTLPEMAMIAGLPAAPNDYSPLSNPKIAKERRDTVLKRMQNNGFITKAQADEAIATPVVTKPSNPKRLERKANYFTDYIQQELPKYISKEKLAQQGLTIETTLNVDWQNAAEEAVQETVKREGRWQGFKQASLVAIDPRTGQIKAMVGGKDFYNQQFNRVTQAKRQPGSTFKTFVYATAVAAGISPNRGYLDAPYTVDGYTPKNYGDKFRGWVNIRDAFTHSINVVALKTLIDVGWEPTIDVAKKMGIESTLHPTYSLALGASEVNLLEITSAYGTLATQGLHTNPYGIHRILDQHGKVIYEGKSKSERAIDQDTAAIMTWMLRNVVKDGTGRSAQLDNRPVAGKTGTSDEARDLWFIGYIPQMVAGVWLGNDDNKPTSGASSTAASTWHQFMEKVVKDMEVEKFPDRPTQLENRKPTIKAQPIRPKRAITKAIPNSDSDSDSASERNSERTSRRRSRTENSYSGSSRSNTSENTSLDDSSSRRRRRRRRSSESQSASQSSSESQSETPRRSRRRRSSGENTSSTESSSRRRRSSGENTSSNESSSRRSSSRRSSSRRSSSRRSSSRSSDSNATESSNSTSTRSSSKRRRSSQRSEPSTSSPAPAPRRRRARYESAPAAAPPAPPASRKVSEPARSRAPVAPAPPPEPPAPAAE
ncbi:transglycosylase domain-containing protein [Allocoleopsis franciscana]|uniref:Penicillin-binding protein, 1A family n=1 Tax=Allocoleopsis franciscana PCC 7113 TaxID=1173027 RepID=K9WK28_9CYAN|nr:penicillin-binding protein 1A [Allocoleopsis franciscana]AFZ20109.1 penicillin-binding protein, 1A family [Allocoleopsis franciscana PCC 7113]